jgi:Ca2+-binding RTX toxin-like protein
VYRSVNSGVSATPPFESLEGRRLLSASASVHGNRLVIRGTAGADEIHVAERIDNVLATPLPDAPVVIAVRVNGGAFEAFSLPRTARVIISTGRGDDFVHLTALPVYIGDDPDLRAMPLAARVDAGAGDDRVLCGRGGSFVSGGPGNDLLDGGTGDDVMLGGAGDDYLVGNDGADRLFGGPGADAFTANDPRSEQRDLGPRDILNPTPTLTE